MDKEDTVIGVDMAWSEPGWTVVRIVYGANFMGCVAEVESYTTVSIRKPTLWKWTLRDAPIRGYSQIAFDCGYSTREEAQNAVFEYARKWKEQWAVEAEARTLLADRCHTCAVCSGTICKGELHSMMGALSPDGGRVHLHLDCVDAWSEVQRERGGSLWVTKMLNW